jgi:negative regulator of flagellin synthesis FlgM
MNVSNDLQGLQPLFPNQETGKARASQASAETQSTGSTTDQATLSTAASAAAQAAPDADVRMEKVAEVQQALAAGTYNVPASAVADKMISQMMGRG